MSIERTQSTQSEAARQVDKARDRPHDKAREPEPGLADRFRNLMQARAEGKEPRPDPRLQAQGHEPGESARAAGQGEGDRPQVATDQAVQRKGGDEGEGGRHAGGDTLQPAELAAIYQAQLMAREVPVAPPPAAPTAHANPQALADMLERHVRQLAVGPQAGDDRGQVLLRLNDATLPGTDLLLSRTDRGWLLRAEVRSRGSYEAIRQAAPQLAERFASRNLGMLEIDPHFHG